MWYGAWGVVWEAPVWYGAWGLVWEAPVRYGAWGLVWMPKNVAGNPGRIPEDFRKIPRRATSGSHRIA